MIANILGFHRAEEVSLTDDLIKALVEEVPKPTWREFESSISPVWASVISSTGHLVSGLLNGVSNSEMKNYYENFFRNGLSDGAAVGANMSRPATLFKLINREKRRLSLLHALAEKSNSAWITNDPDFGCPWQMKYAGESVNFEMTDHRYFALFLRPILNRICADELIFLGDGCGYLSQAIISVVDCDRFKKVTFIDLYHFLARQFLLWSIMDSPVSANYLNGERSDYPTSSSPKILINQDSMVEISEIQQLKYFEYMQANNVVALCSYNKYDSSAGHHDFRSSSDSIFGEPLIRVPSPTRGGYWFEVWVKPKNLYITQ